MRIVTVVLSLEIGGQERLVVRIIQALAQRGHDVQVVTLTRGGALRSELGSVPVHEVPFRGAGKEAHGFDPTLHLRLFRLFRKLRPDVVHTHNGAPLVYAATAGKLTGAKIIHTKHGNAKFSPRAMLLVRIASRFTDHFVAVAKDTAEMARQNEQPPESRLTVIENGIPLGAFGPNPEARAKVRAELGIPEGARVVGSVGRLVSEKDYPLLVRAIAPLLDDKTRLVLVGEGDARPAIEAAIAEHVPADKRGFVRLTGARRDVPHLYASFDVFAMSSRTEGLPLALPEAMTSQLPIVATQVGGVPSVVPKEAGVLVPHGDPEALRASIRGFLEDETRRRSVGEAARSYALGRFSEETMLDQYLALYGRGGRER